MLEGVYATSHTQVPKLRGTIVSTTHKVRYALACIIGMYVKANGISGIMKSTKKCMAMKSLRNSSGKNMYVKKLVTSATE